MDAQQILDMLLTSGQQLVNKGKTLAEEQLNLPENAADRQTMLDGASKGAMAAGAAALLLGTSVGRKLTGAGLKLGSLAAIGNIAFNAFQAWQSQQTAAPVADAASPVVELAAPTNEQRGKALLTAMIAAAKVDGTVDDKEKEMITLQLAKLNLGDSANLFAEELNKPLDIKAVAAGADSPTMAAEIYLISRAILDLDNEQERQYIEALAKELGLAPDLVAQLESHIQA
ncbi:MAG: tellurite resistance TerB family protein [Methylococcales bacterium]|nr:tellurite resistance TerB family protein [Methylococcales bacterium]